MSQSSEVLEFTVPGAARDGGDVPENLRVFAGAIIDSAGPTLATVLNRAVALETPTVSRATVNELLTSDPLPWVVAEVPYQRGLTGRHWLIVTAPSVRYRITLTDGKVVEVDNPSRWPDPTYIENIEEPVIMATILALMGMDHTALTYLHQGRDERLTDVYGNVIREIIA